MACIRRDDSIDMMRGIAILCVLFAHSESIPYSMMQWLIPFYVPAFFFISGYLKKDMNYSIEHIRNRLKKLTALYFIYNFILVFSYALINRKGMCDILCSIIGVVYSRFCLFPNISTTNNIYFLTSCNSPLWFLTALVVAEMIYTLVCWGITKGKQWYLIFTGLIIIGYIATYIGILLPWSLDTAMIGTVFMMAGYYYKIKEKTMKKWIILSVIVYIIVVKFNPDANMSVRYYGPWNMSIILFVAGGITGSMLVKAVCDICEEYFALGPIKNLLTIVGRNSLPIFAFHWFLFWILDVIVKKLDISIGVNYVYGILKIGITIIICLIYSKMKHWIWKGKHLNTGTM